MKYKYVLFDWDGCLAKTLELWLEAYQQTLNELGIKKTDREIGTVFGSWQGGSELGAPDNDIFFKRVDSIVEDRIPKVDLHENAVDTIHKLIRSNYILIILSSSYKKFIIPALKLHKIQDAFGFVITGEDVTKHKPDPEAINLAIEKLGGNKKKYIMVGDSYKDVMAAKNAGIDSILYFPKEHGIFYDYEDLIKTEPTHTISNLKEIYDLITRK